MLGRYVVEVLRLAVVALEVEPGVAEHPGRGEHEHVLGELLDRLAVEVRLQLGERVAEAVRDG